MKFKQKPMVNWYDTRQLASTGLKTVISSLFGNFADKREIQATLSNNDPYNYSENEEFWIDYISDLGDGFDATYTMAHLLAKDQIEMDGKALKRGKILIMGGDEVYPTPEIEEYKNRLQGPYHAAFPEVENDPDPPHLFALPGNHDWYDGLSNFIKLFCQQRKMGNWRTRQKRSYFAIKLPHNYWIWGIDIQLHADIDKPQLDYFKEIGKEMQKDDKVVLCTAEPAWMFHSINKKDTSYKRLKWFVKEYILKNGFNPVVMITGDFHHYSHYTALKKNENEPDHLFTSGGGGAFMHPTHILKKRLRDEDLVDSKLCGVFPSKKESRSMAFLNLLFPFINSGMAVFLGVFHLFTAWILLSNARGLYGTIGQMPFDLSEISTVYLSNIISNPGLALLNLLLVAGLFLFTDTSFGKGKLNYIAGGAHALLQLSAFYFMVWGFARFNIHYLDINNCFTCHVSLFSFEMVAGGGILSGIIFGIYLLISALFFESHPTEAYSSFKGRHYKNFLRLHLTKEKLSIYPIGVRKIVTNWKNVSTEDNPVFEGDAIKYELIEGPIHINNSNYEQIVESDNRFTAGV